MKIRVMNCSSQRWSLAVIAVCASAVFLNFSATALAKPFLEKIDLFEEKTNGFVQYRIPGIVVTAKGTVLEAVSPLRTERGYTAETLSLVSMVNLSTGRFQPVSSTVVCPPAGPPSGKMLHRGPCQ